KESDTSCGAHPVGSRGGPCEGRTGARSMAVAGTERVARDRGYTVTETIVAMLLLALVVVPILAAVRTSVQASSVSRSAARIETAIVNAAEAVNRSPLTCDEDGYAPVVTAALAATGVAVAPGTGVVVRAVHAVSASDDDSGTGG